MSSEEEPTEMSLVGVIDISVLGEHSGCRVLHFLTHSLIVSKHAWEVGSAGMCPAGLISEK